MITRRTALLFFVLAMLAMACAKIYFRDTYAGEMEFLHRAPHLQNNYFLKAHMRNGDVIVFSDNWQLANNGNSVIGIARKYDYNRSVIGYGEILIPIDSVAIFETNKKILSPESERIAALGVLAGVDVIVGLLCLTNPKACFGSCPTFYFNENTSVHYANAEGFSNAISPSMAYTDIDAMGSVRSENGSITLFMKNEALETHCIQNLKLGVIDKKHGGEVLQSTNGEYYQSNRFLYPIVAYAGSSDILDKIKSPDLNEYYSVADNERLDRKEFINLEFPAGGLGDSVGLLLDFRQTLMTTYFIYNAIAYMGDEVGDVFAGIERNPKIRKQIGKGLHRLLGGIRAETFDPQTGKWIYWGEFDETGPIAINRQMLLLPTFSKGEKIKIRLQLNTGLWRIDQAKIAVLSGKVQPRWISPADIRLKGKKDSRALGNLLGGKRPLISMPGDCYAIDFPVGGQNQEYAVFLASTGYYLEWMRADWLKDKNIPKLYQLINSPQAYLQSIKADYKQHEQGMEEAFWNSRIDTRNFSYHEN